MQETNEAAQLADCFPPNSFIRVLYVFSGLPRQADIRARLEFLQDQYSFVLQMVEFDLLRDQSHDVSLPHTWKHLCSLIDSGSFDVLIISPPCNTFSRARHAFRRSPGPKPLRNVHWPLGFPWLEGQNLQDVSLANQLIDRSVSSCSQASTVGTFFIFEHPEDLGITVDDERPASIWQLDALRQLQITTEAYTWALYQCEYGKESGLACADTSKPTRLLSTLPAASDEPYQGWPEFNTDFAYIGPLPHKCSHSGHKPLIGQDSNGRFKTAPSAAYPPAMCHRLADLIVRSVLLKRLKGGQRNEVSGKLSSRLDKDIDGVSVTDSTLFDGASPKELTLADGVSAPDLSPTDGLAALDVTMTDGVSAPDLTPTDGFAALDVTMTDGVSATDLSLTEGFSALDSTDLHLRHDTRLSQDIDGCCLSPEDLAALDGKLLESETQKGVRMLGHEEDWSTSEDDEDGFRKVKKNEKPGGIGPPLGTYWGGKEAEFHDGFGLPSPTRWHPASRGLASTLEASDFSARLAELVRAYTLKAFPNLSRSTFELALGRFKESPVPETLIQELRMKWFAMLPQPELASQVPESQPFFLHAVGQTLRLMDDPDHRIIDLATDSYVSGVPVGTDCKMPRTPAVFLRKKKWRQYDQTELLLDVPNYSSALEAADSLEAQFREEEQMGMMFPVTLAVAQKLYPGDRLRIAAQGAIKKPDNTYRPLHDATHGVNVNSTIKPRDQLSMPGPPEAATSMQICQDEYPGAHFSIAADISKAHRRVKHRKADWGLLACRSKPCVPGEADVIWINKVGTFGIGSIAYYWSRLAACLGRLVSRLWGNECAWQFIFADDLHINAGGPFKYLTLLSTIVTWLMLGTPFTWKKFRGGLCLDWCGYYLDYRRFQLGISEARCKWLIDFIRKVLINRVVLMRHFVEALGRLGFTSQVLTWSKPFLAPLYAWSARVPDGTTLKIPEVVSYTLIFLQEQFEKGNRMVPCSKPEVYCTQLFRTDAKCEELRVILSGWWCRDSLITKEAPWFALTLGKEQVPWLFREGKGSSWASTSAEMLAVVVALIAFSSLLPQAQRISTQIVIKAGTDNQALQSLSFKESSTKIPLLFVMMQLSITAARYNVRTNLQWRPRELNTEADALSNLNFEGFNDSMRVHIKWEELPIDLLRSLVAHASHFTEQVNSNRALNITPPKVRKRKRKTHEKTVWG